MPWFVKQQKNILPKELPGLLKKIKVLDTVERAYVEGLFIQYYRGGISRKEVEQAVHDLTRNTKDSIDPQEAKAIRDELLTYLDKK